MRRTILFLTAIALLTFSACSSGNTRLATSADRDSTANSSIQPTGTPASAADAGAQKRLDVSFQKASDGQVSTESTAVERKIIRNAELTIETQNSEESFRKVSSLAEAKGS